MPLIFIFIVFFVFTFTYIYRESFVFSLVYLFLFFYTIFTQFAYVLYPEKLYLYSGGQYYGSDIFIYYWLYIFLSFIFIFILFIMFYKQNFKLPIKLEISEFSKYKSFYGILYILLIIGYELIMSFLLIKNYANLSYYNQYILKRNTLWFYLFSINGIVLLSIFCKILLVKDKFTKILYSLVFFVSLIVFIITSLRAGQRIELFQTFLAFTSFLYLFFLRGLNLQGYSKKLKTFAILFLGMVIMIGISQSIRTLRGSAFSFVDLIVFMRDPKIFLSFFSFENLVFQDWAIPSLTLVTSIKRDLIFPFVVLESNLKVLIPFIEHPSLGSILSRIIDPGGWAGYGYYILTEGYNFIGFLGFLYSSFIFVIGLRFLELFFTRTKDKLFNTYNCSLIVFSCISIVRGQSISLLKIIYLYFLPAIILFTLMSKKKVYLVKLI